MSSPLAGHVSPINRRLPTSRWHTKVCHLTARVLTHDCFKLGGWEENSNVHGGALRTPSSLLWSIWKRTANELWTYSLSLIHKLIVPSTQQLFLTHVKILCATILVVLFLLTHKLLDNSLPLQSASKSRSPPIFWYHKLYTRYLLYDSTWCN